MFGFGFYETPRNFKATYRCYSVSMLPGNERLDVERGGKIIMPPSALDQLTRLSIVYPMLFKITNTAVSKVSHCGVLEFVADEGKVYLPYWMMRNLLLDEGSVVQVESATLPVATFSKFQPQSVDFLDITNPKAVLENALRNFACLTTGDVIAINYNDKVYELCVLETQPKDAVTIIECDMRVEFAAPVGYTEPNVKQDHSKSNETEADVDLSENKPLEDMAAILFTPFAGSGNRLDGKARNSEQQEAAAAIKARVPAQRGIPDYNYKIGYIKFSRHFKEKPKEEAKDNEQIDEESQFPGEGQSLKKRKE